MKRIVVVVLLVTIAGIAGIVRSRAKSGSFDRLTSHNATEQSREEIRQSYELSPGASVEISNINGAVKIDTSDNKVAEVLIERTGASSEALSRRKVMIEADGSNLRIHGEKGDVGFFERLFGTSPSERVTLKVPRQIALHTKGINGAVVVGDLDGPVDIRGVNGRVQIAAASGADFKGVNGNIVLGLKGAGSEGVSLNGINGNIELQLAQAFSADFDARGINGRVASDLSDVMIEKGKHGSYSGRIGSGGAPISVRGINGNIRFTRVSIASEPSDSTNKDKSVSTKL